MESQQQGNATSIALFMSQLTAFTEALRQKDSDLIDMLLKQVKDYFVADNESHQPVTDHNFVIDALPSEMVDDLHYTAKCMVAAGFEKECCEAYSSCRREFLEKCVSSLSGLQKHHLENLVGVDYDSYMIRRTIKAFKVALRILFPKFCQGSIIHLPSFADAVVTRSPSLSLLFIIVSMFETLRDLIPECESLFSESLLDEVIGILNRLAEAISKLAVKFRYLTFNISAATVTIPAGGRIHPMTIHVMGDLCALCRSRQWQTSEQNLQEYPPKGADSAETSTSFSVQVVSIMEELEEKLKDTSKTFKDPALRYFFHDE